MILGPRQSAYVAALKEYEGEQAGGLLRIDDAWCPLGLACKVMGLASGADKFGIHTFEGETSRLPESAVEYYGFRDANGGHVSGAEEDAISNLSDDHGFGARDIAKLLEENPGKYFVRSV